MSCISGVEVYDELNVHKTCSQTFVELIATFSNAN